MIGFCRVWASDESHTQWRKRSGSKFFPGNYYPCFPTPPLYWLVIQRVNRGNLADQLRLLQLPQPGAHQHRPHTEDPVTPTNSVHQGDRPASLLANPTGTRRGDSVTMTLFSRRVSAGQKRQPNNTVGAAQPSTLMTNCWPNDGRTKKYGKKVDLHFMHDSRTWRQCTGVKTLSHTPTLLIWINFYPSMDK